MIRPATPQDHNQLLELLQLNTPAYFASAEEADFIDYLHQHAQHYFVVEEAGKLIGAGGYNLGFDNGKTARISWDIIHPTHQGKGIGKQLINYRIEQLRKISEVSKIVVRTSQLAHAFYAKMGFELAIVEKDYWADGFDLYLMELYVK